MEELPFDISIVDSLKYPIYITYFRTIGVFGIVESDVHVAEERILPVWTVVRIKSRINVEEKVPLR
jgi:hypothetical protein